MSEIQTILFGFRMFFEQNRLVFRQFQLKSPNFQNRNAFGFRTDLVQTLRPERLKTERAKIQTVIWSDFGIFPISDVQISAFHCT